MPFLLNEAPDLVLTKLAKLKSLHHHSFFYPVTHCDRHFFLSNQKNNLSALEQTLSELKITDQTEQKKISTGKIYLQVNNTILVLINALKMSWPAQYQQQLKKALNEISERVQTEQKRLSTVEENTDIDHQIYQPHSKTRASLLKHS